MQILEQLEKEADAMLIKLQSLHKAPPPSSEKIDSWMKGFNDGRFADINYPPKKVDNAEELKALYDHLDRVKAIGDFVEAHGENASDNYVVAATQALNFYAVQDYQTNNWWDRQIGLARRAAIAAVLLSKRPESGQLLLTFLPYIMKTTNADAPQTGANLADFSYIQLLWASAALAMSKNAIYSQYIESSSSVISSLCFPVKRHGPENGEGRSVDYSISQHNQGGKYSQLYSGTYGIELIGRIFSSFSALQDSPFALKEKAVYALEDFFLQGLGRQLYAGKFDFHVCGRGVSRPDKYGNSAFEKWLEQLLEGQVNHREALIKLRQRVRTGNEQSNRYFIGNRVFWVNDYMAHITQNFCIWSKVISTRTVGTESGNGENLKGYYMGGGSYFLSRHGGEYENIQPIWDWKRIPGTTVEQDPNFAFPLVEWGQGAQGSHDFAGGVSDGDIGATSMILTRQKIKDARKSVIALNDQIFCLGSHINTSDAPYPVVTSVNQSILRGTVQVKYYSGEIKEVELGQKIKSNQISAVAHDGFVYSFAQNNGQSITVELAERSGSWYEINKRFSKDEIKGAVFSLWVNHGRGQAENYSYTIYCGNIDDASRIKIVEGNFVATHTAHAHFVTSIDKHKVIGTVFSINNSFWIELANDVSIRPLAPVSFIATVSGDELTITCADLSQKLKDISFEVRKGFFSLPMNMKINLPAGDEAGRGCTLRYNVKVEI